MTINIAIEAKVVKVDGKYLCLALNKVYPMKQDISIVYNGKHEKYYVEFYQIADVEGTKVKVLVNKRPLEKQMKKANIWEED